MDSLSKAVLEKMDNNAGTFLLFFVAVNRSTFIVPLILNVTSGDILVSLGSGLVDDLAIFRTQSSDYDCA